MPFALIPSFVVHVFQNTCAVCNPTKSSKPFSTVVEDGGSCFMSPVFRFKIAILNDISFYSHRYLKDHALAILDGDSEEKMKIINDNKNIQE